MMQSPRMAFVRVTGNASPPPVPRARHELMWSGVFWVLNWAREICTFIISTSRKDGRGSPYNESNLSMSAWE